MRLRFSAFVCLIALCLASGCGPKKTPPDKPSSTTSAAKAKPVGPPPKPRTLNVSERFKGARQARIDDDYVIVILADGDRTLLPLYSLDPDDQTWLTRLAKEHPLPKGNSSMVVVASTTPIKKTIEVSKTEDGIETVQLCPPNVIRNQIGATCMMYARVHWLDIAGFPVDNGAIYKIINDTPPDHPWTERRYRDGLTGILEGFQNKPQTHVLPPEEDPFEWARQELRQGRPLLAALPREIWQALPPGFVAAHPWKGGSVGHQIVINGFTWNEATQQGTFHVVNSWAELLEFDLETEATQRGMLVIEQSLSPIGEVVSAAVKARAEEKVQKITLVKAVGSTNLYEVHTNQGTRRIAAPDEDSARDLVEQGR